MSNCELFWRHACNAFATDLALRSIASSVEVIAGERMASETSVAARVGRADG